MYITSKHYLLTGVQLKAVNREVENHAFLPFFVLNGHSLLLCVSNSTDCCTEDNANWFLPGSTTALTNSSSPYSVSRSSTDPRYVALRRDEDVDGVDRNDDDGLYRCEIIDTDGNIQMLYVWMDIESPVDGKYYV